MAIRSLAGLWLALFVVSGCSHDGELEELGRQRRGGGGGDCSVSIASPAGGASFGPSADIAPTVTGLQIELAVRLTNCKPGPVSFGLCTRDLAGQPVPPVPWEGEVPRGSEEQVTARVTLSNVAGTQLPCVQAERLAIASVTRVCEGAEVSCGAEPTCRTDTQTNKDFCGPSCLSCPGDIHGSPSCVAGVCGLACEPDYHYEAGKCRYRPGCEGLEAACAGGADCCAVDFIHPDPGQQLRFVRGYDASQDMTELPYFQPLTPDAAVTIQPFYLDRFEVTVSRFRRFVDGYESWRSAGNPKTTYGQHPKISASVWRDAWYDARLTRPDGRVVHAVPPSRQALIEQLTNSDCGDTYSWSDLPAERESLPINCVHFYLANMFCVWDSDTRFSRLPTEAEWHAAASGAGDQRAYPWSVPAGSLDIEGRVAVGGTDRRPDPVGSYPKGLGKWSSLDLSGNVYEWVRDTVLPHPFDPRTGTAAATYNPFVNYPNDPINLMGDDDSSTLRILRGGSFKHSETVADPRTKLRSIARTEQSGWVAYNDVGFRCARNFED